MDKSQIIQQAYLVSEILEEDENFPNNKSMPLLVYKGALFLHPDDNDDTVKQIFAENNWTNAWTDGIYDYHHYHSITHEVLGVVCGTADVQFGGPNGKCIVLTRGDVVIIPAGVAHKKLSGTDDFSCVGAYPHGAQYDMNYGNDAERPQADENISKVHTPELDPVYGNEGHLKECWN
ncbi:hypothetical protein GS399_17350 [Pedobacter sp. HMF7647]|uniref:Cupin type-1 domain-containing protein n=1 Tax=Hufsiella arboris TaxID=2695275 RepID=A0A7K1YDT7_9SPHI|nr:cupin domain-containing protein [Hufsiella arboris]MXV52742.1 hypothetical protein [Hufsiella arboris]